MPTKAMRVRAFPQPSVRSLPKATTCSDAKEKWDTEELVLPEIQREYGAHWIDMPFAGISASKSVNGANG
jgi:hypothetical protein